MNLASAEKAIRNGVLAGFIYAGYSLGMVSFAQWTHPKGYLGLWADPVNFLVAPLMIGLAVGIQQRSRTAAIILFVLTLFAVVIAYIEMGHYVGVAMFADTAVTIVLIYFLGRATQGTFAYHRIRREQDPEYRPVSRGMIFFWVPASVVGVVLLGLPVFYLVTLVMGGPYLRVVTGDELKLSHAEILLTEGIVDPGEDVVLFYSAGIFSIRENGNVITNSRVISYYEIEDYLSIRTGLLDEMKNITVLTKGGSFSDTVLLVVFENGAEFKMDVTTYDDGDVRFLDELNKRMR